ncbi:MAG: tetratricopeptide repeat protein [Hyphomicrobiaceae bacterium]|nr:MAG: tetratricopeptide repeat protein [Hyphomicrobiaceae bacterium]
MTETNSARLVGTARPFRLGDCDIDPASCRVRNGGQVVKLQPQAVAVLSYLAARPGQVITRDEIESAVWEGRTVGYDALTGTMFKLRKALGDDPKSPRLIETISKRGYRLLTEPQPAAEPFDDLWTPEELPAAEPLPERGAPVAASEMAPSPPGDLLPASAPAGPGAERPSLLRHVRKRLAAPGYASVAALVALLVLLAAGIALRSMPQRAVVTAAPATAKSSIVVLPFRLLGEPAKGDYLADGLTDDLTTALAMRSDLLVISREAAFIYKGQEVSDTNLGARLDVRYVLRGTIHRGGTGLRINARLIDTAKGQHVWAEQFDGVELNDNIARRIVDSLIEHIAPRSQHAVDAPGLPTTRSPEAYDAFLAGRQHFYAYSNKSENEKARALFEQALQYDRDFALAHAMLGWTYVFEAMNGWSKDRASSLQKALANAQKAISINKDIPMTYFVTGMAYREQGEYIKALVEAQKAIALDPNYANGHVLVASLLYYTGRPEESIEPVRKAMRLNPHYPFNFNFHLGQAYFVLHRYDDAIKAFQAGIAKNPGAERLHVWLAAALAHAGRIEDAKWEVEQVLMLNPNFSLAAIAKVFPFKNKTDADHFLGGLRKAGFS